MHWCGGAGAEINSSLLLLVRANLSTPTSERQEEGGGGRRWGRGTGEHITQLGGGGMRKGGGGSSLSPPPPVVEGVTPSSLLPPTLSPSIGKKKFERLICYKAL